MNASARRLVRGPFFRLFGRLFFWFAVAGALPFAAWAPAAAEEEDAKTDPRAILDKAVAAQGQIRAKDLQDIVISFKGHAAQEGQLHRVLRTFWYRPQDGSFKVKTSSRTDARKSSERGVSGEKTYWEKRRRDITTLSPRDGEDRKLRSAIERERGEFRRVLRMVILSRLQQDDQIKLTLATPRPVLLPRDVPHEADAILGANRDAVTYWVLDVEREGDPRIRLYIRTDDSTVRKAVEFSKKNPKRIYNVYYFGPFSKKNERRIMLPLYFSMHFRIPVDKESRDKTTVAYGRVGVDINTGWEPPSPNKN